MKQEMTMGSLFSGSGGFELASDIFGIRPVWASEVEPLPILITKKNFPNMKHLGDINYLKGNKIDPVTVIAGGSPCQDMSIAGQRAGLDGSRSNLFREQIRVVKEMRNHDSKAGRTGKYIRPRYMVWENVPGAFSSNKGKDFQSVLEEIARVADETATVPLPPKSRWANAGCIMGDNFSIAWRVLDAQYWGVPQRRKRIYLVADFGGNTAPKILFERKGLSRDFKESREAWQRAAGDIKAGTHQTGTENVECYDISDRRRIATANGDTSPTLAGKMGTGGNNVPITLQIRSGCEGGGKGALIQENMSATLSTHNTQTLFDPKVIETHGQDARWNISEDNVVQTLASNMGTGGGNVPMIMNNEVIPIADKATRYKGGGDTRNNDGSANGLGVGEPGAPANTLTAADRHAVATYQRIAGPLMANSHPGSYTGQDAFSDMLVANEYVVRRLTPLECGRLQGFPDNWTDDISIENPTANTIREWMIAWAEWWRLIGRDEGIQLPKDAKQVERWLADPASDSGIYKMWGNGIALPCAMFVMEGIAMVLELENQNEERMAETDNNSLREPERN